MGQGSGWSVERVTQLLQSGRVKVERFNDAYARLYMKRPVVKAASIADPLNRFFAEGEPEFNAPVLIPMCIAAAAEGSDEREYMLELAVRGGSGVDAEREGIGAVTRDMLGYAFVAADKQHFRLRDVVVKADEVAATAVVCVKGSSESHAILRLQELLSRSFLQENSNISFGVITHRHEISLNGQMIMRGDELSMAVVFNNLTGRNFSRPAAWQQQTYAEYLQVIEHELGVVFAGGTLKLTDSSGMELKSFSMAPAVSKDLHEGPLPGI